jgi:hypothetical protein
MYGILLLNTMYGIFLLNTMYGIFLLNTMYGIFLLNTMYGIFFAFHLLTSAILRKMPLLSIQECYFKNAIKYLEMCFNEQCAESCLMDVQYKFTFTFKSSG